MGQTAAATLNNHVEAFDAEAKKSGLQSQRRHTRRLTADPAAAARKWLDGKTMHPLLAIAVFVVVFLEIHPFQDGNGLLSRVLTTLLLLQSGYAYVPYSSLESVIEQSKDGYYLALRRTGTSGPRRRTGTRGWGSSPVAATAEAGAGAEDRARARHPGERCLSCR